MHMLLAQYNEVGLLSFTDESNKDTDMRSKCNMNVKHILDMHAKG